MTAKRVYKELTLFVSAQCDNNSINVVSSPDTLQGPILVNITVPDNPLYADQTFTISYDPIDGYPFSPPVVVFTGENIPLHPHVYSNGHICLDILYDSWTPIQTISSVVLSLQSMLQSNNVGERPPDDTLHCSRGSSNPTQTKWFFHDDTV